MISTKTLQDLIDYSQLPGPIFLHIMPATDWRLSNYQNIFVTKGHEGISVENKYQKGRNFLGAKTIISMIPLDRYERYLFAGAYCVNSDSRDEYRTPEGEIYYLVDNTYMSHEINNWLGRIIFKWGKPTRNRYRKAPGAANDFDVVEIRERAFNSKNIPFPGYQGFHLSREEFDITIGGQGLPTWRAALSSVAGVYSITDKKTGDTYIGSAYSGEGGNGDGIWGRWRGYAGGGDNGNILLRQHILKHSAKNLIYSVLQTMDIRSSKESVIAVESFFKEAFGTRVHGLNAN